MPDFIQQLPVELVAHIFSLTCQAGYSKVVRGHDIGLLEALLSVSSICSRGRRIALSTSNLWTHIDITQSSTIIPFLRLASRLQAHLERSRNASIDVALDFHPFHPLSEQKFIWAMLVPHLHRCRSLGMMGMRIQLADYIFPISGTGPLKCLEDLNLEHLGTRPVKGPLFSNDDALPKLAKLTLQNIFFTTGSTTSITHLTVKHMSMLIWTEFLVFLAPLHHLEHLNVSSVIGEDDDPPLQPLILPNLTSLLILDTCFDRYIATPKLEHLTCLSFSGEINRVRSLPNLQRLTLYEPLWNALTDWDPSPSLASVQTLDLIECNAVHHVLNLLLSSRPTHSLSTFTSLRKLYLDECFAGGSLFWPRPHPRHLLFRVLDARPELPKVA